jgi:sialate O-acetylesterase
MDSRKIFVAILILIVETIYGISAYADVSIPRIIGENMVLQRDMEIPVWGLAEPGEKVIVKMNGCNKEAEADPNGRWMVKLPAMGAGGPYEMTINGKNSISLKNIMVGEVWVCSGQSNMELPVGDAKDSAKEVSAANYPAIRFFKIPRKTSGRPLSDVNAVWCECNPETAREFSAVGYFFGRSIHKELSVSVGLIDSSWGGSRIEPWTSPEGFKMVEKTADIAKRIENTNSDYRKSVSASLRSIEQWLPKVKKAIAGNSQLPADPDFPKHQLDGFWEPTGIYNAMIAPIVPFAIRGVIWYQGEANLGEGMLYYERMKVLIGGWRKVWAEGDFPFYYVQLAPYRYTDDTYYRSGGDPYKLPAIWEAQTKAMSIPNTGMAVTVDITDNVSDIHPTNKQDVGKRLSLWALAKTYGKKEIVYSGPMYKEMKKEDGKIRVYFDYIGGGLATGDGKEPKDFEIAGADKKYEKAKAVIDKDTVIVWSEEIKEPAAVRFAWHQEARPNLCNKEGLPACPFRTEN